MKTSIMKPKAFVKVVSVSNKEVPLDFPWLNNVLVTLLGDLSDLNNLRHELNQIKALVNQDISKFNMNLKDYSIQISWPE
jgi:hypothetical protein